MGGNTEDAFRRSPPWSLPPHRTATPAPRRGRLWEEPTLSGLHAAPTLRPTPSHHPPSYTIPSGGLAAIGVSTRRLCRPSTGKYVLWRKHPFWQIRRWYVPEKLDMGPSGTRISLARKDTNPSDQPSGTDDDRSLPPLHTTVSRDQHSPSLNWPNDDLRRTIHLHTECLFLPQGQQVKITKARPMRLVTAWVSDRRIRHRPSDTCPFE